jgi:tripartite-type tricarboxylate transporter receptor subunit TctC
MTKLIHKTPSLIGRRSFLKTSGAAAAVGASGLIMPSRSFAQEFPARNIDIIIPTGEGGGADRDARAFTSIWSRHLPTNFQFGYYPGAAGQVGYQFYMQREPDAYSLIFANLGPEVIMLELQNTGINVGDDIVFIQQTLSEPMAVWVGPNSPFRTLEELIEEGQRRPITVSTSRLPHPASIGMLAMGEAMGVEFILVPYGGGNPTAMAAITQEVDCSALPVTNTIVLDDQARVLGIFADENVSPEGTDNAPTVNAALGISLPELTSSRAWGIHRAAYDAHPERVARLIESMEATLADPDYVTAVEGTGVPAAYIDPGNEERAMQSARDTIELARRYRDLLTGS